MRLEGQRGQDHLYPNETVLVSVSPLDNISDIKVTGRVNLSLSGWESSGRSHTMTFPAPEPEGLYILTITGYQDGDIKTRSHKFAVEAFALYVFPDRDLLIVNGSDRQSTTVRLELVNWVGDPLAGRVNVTITRSDIDDPGSQITVDRFFIETTGRSEFIFQPPSMERSTLYRVMAAYQDHEPVECGIVVQPFELTVTGPRPMLSGGGTSVNGPFYPLEEVVIDIDTPGHIDGLNVTEIVEHTILDHAIQGDRLSFVPPKAGIYRVSVVATMGQTRAETHLLVAVNDWPIELTAPAFTAPGEPLTVSVKRENGAFIAVRALLVNERILPVTALTELFETRSTDAYEYRKGLLDSTGSAEVTFRPPADARPGRYLAIVDLGSWEEEVVYHGLTVAWLVIHDSEGIELELPHTFSSGLPFHETHSHRHGFVILGKKLEIDGEMFDPDGQGRYLVSLGPGEHTLRVGNDTSLLVERTIAVPGMEKTEDPPPGWMARIALVVSVGMVLGWILGMARKGPRGDG